MADITSQLSILVKVKDEAASALRNISNNLENMSGSFRNLGAQADRAAGMIAAIGGIGFGLAIREATKMNEAMLKVGILLKGTGFNLDEVRKKAEEMTRVSIFGADEIAPVLARNISLYKNMTTAVDQTKFAQDLAAFSGMGLADTQRIISKASDENIMALKRLALTMGISIGDIDEHANKQEQYGIILDRVREKIRGYDEQLLATSGIKQMNKQFAEMAQTIGEIVLPSLNNFITNGLVPVLKNLQAWGERWPVVRDQIVNATLAIVAFAGAWKLLGFHLVSLTVAAQAFGAGILAIASPITIIAALIASLIIGLQQYRKTVDEIQAASKSAIATEDMNMRAIQRARELRAQGKTAEADRLLDAVRKNINIPVPAMAEGGIITRPTYALIGEAGPEAVIPLRRPATAGAGGGITINLQGDFYTEDQVAEKWANRIADILKYQLKLAI